jgi:hypothetical protein
MSNFQVEVEKIKCKEGFACFAITKALKASTYWLLIVLQISEA